jgi:hypothetical protein
MVGFDMFGRWGFALFLRVLVRGPVTKDMGLYKWRSSPCLVERERVVEYPFVSYQSRMSEQEGEMQKEGKWKRGYKAELESLVRAS